MAESTGRYTSSYDAVGQTMVTASPNNQRNTYSYDPIGTRRSLDVSGAGRFTSQYDPAGQLTSLVNPFAERTTFAYDDAGRRNVQRNANGTRVSTVYDAASQTTQVIHRKSDGSPLLQLEYRYDNAGNRNGMIEGGGTARTTWSYDNSNQLTSEYRTGTHAYRQSFTFDPAGNRTLKNIDGARTTYAYDPANQLKYGQAAAGRTTFQYDLTGNQQIEQPPTGNRTTTTWNYENQPIQYLLPSGAPVTMAYNGDNRRVVKQQGTDITKFVWDSVIDAYVKELDGSNVLIATYTNEPQPYGVFLSQRRGSTTHILHADGLGTTRLLTDSTQTTTDTYLYDAWGNLTTSSGTTVMPFRWVGRNGYYQDENTGLVYVRARMYQPTVARWVSSDTVIYLKSGFKIFPVHEYVYVANNPLDKIDTSGMLLIAIDGTGSRAWHADPLFNGQSWVWQFFRDYENEPKLFDHGPDAAVGFNFANPWLLPAQQCQAIENRVYSWLCENWCAPYNTTCEHPPVDLVGHSRGAYIAMQLARRLNVLGCLCENGFWVPVPVRFVGLYDPVDMADPYPADGDMAGDRLSPNVQKWAVVTPEPFRNVVTGTLDAVFSRQAWRRPSFSGTGASHLTVQASHGGIGGAPGDWEPGVLPSWSLQQDTLGAQQADSFVRTEAKSVGVQLRR